MARSGGYRQYIIPENVIESGRIKGFKTRNVVEGVILGGSVGLLLSLIPIEPFTTRVAVIILGAAPLLFLGAVGINGEPVSGYIKHFFIWLKKKGPALYNNSPRILAESPVEAAMDSSGIADMAISKLQEFQEKRRTADAGKTLVEGVDFEFAEDKEETNLLAEHNELEEEGYAFDDSLSFQVEGQNTAEGDKGAIPALEPNLGADDLGEEDLY